MGKLKVGLIGCGYISDIMAKTLIQMPEVECYACAARDIAKAEDFKTKHGFAKAFGSYEELAKDPEVQLVYVATPHSNHAQIMEMLIENNKPILCEKAFTINAREAELILAMAEAKKVFVSEAIWVRYMPMVKIIQDVITSGELGDICALSANLHYNLDHKERIMDPHLAGGALLDVGIYALTFASICFGDNHKKIVADAVMSDTGIDLQNTIIMDYADGKRAVLTSGGLGVSDREGIIYGRKGYMIVQNINNPESISIYNDKHELVRTCDRPAQISGYEYEVLACKKAIEEGRLECDEMPHAETIELMRQMDTIRQQIGLRYPME